MKQWQWETDGKLRIEMLVGSYEYMECATLNGYCKSDMNIVCLIMFE